MANTLLEGGRAALMFLATLGFDRIQSYAQVLHVCAEDTYNDNSRIIFQGWNGAEPGSTWIGTDGADIGYFRLNTIRTSWVEVKNTLTCDVSGHYVHLGYVLTGRTVEVTDGGSDVRPYDGGTIIPHGGYPVCAARRRGPGQEAWVAFAAGDAAAVTVAAARAACGINDFYGDLGGGTGPIDILVKVQ